MDLKLHLLSVRVVKYTIPMVFVSVRWTSEVSYNIIWDGMLRSEHVALLASWVTWLGIIPGFFKSSSVVAEWVTNKLSPYPFIISASGFGRLHNCTIFEKQYEHYSDQSIFFRSAKLISASSQRLSISFLKNTVNVVSCNSNTTVKIIITIYFLKDVCDKANIVRGNPTQNSLYKRWSNIFFL